MDEKDFMLKLIQMLQNNESISSVSKMPDKQCVKNAVQDLKDLKVDELKSYLNNRLELAYIDKSKAKAFLLIPYSKNQWKVFVVDCNDSPYAQLDDYNGAIEKKGNEGNKGSEGNDVNNVNNVNNEDDHIDYCISSIIINR